MLSLFPGIGLLDYAFELEGFCVVRGPDVLWGGDIRRFHPPADMFDGVIGGPPCQAFSTMAPINLARGRTPRFGNLIPEFERIVSEAAPSWFIMENVYRAPVPDVPGYHIESRIINNRYFGGEQDRVRRISFGTPDGLCLSWDVALFEHPNKMPAVTSSVGGIGSGSNYLHFVEERAQKRRRRWQYSVDEASRLQGMPGDFLDGAPFTREGKLRVIANGVPVPMGRAIARAVRRALGLPVLSGDTSELAR